ncbi:hypothetical protein Tco_1428750 [Tanacetum coccineum]
MSSIVNGDDLPKEVAIDERPKAKQIECNEISVVEVDDGDDQFEHHIETEHVGCADFHHEIISTTEVEVEEEEEGHIGTLLADVEDREDQTDNMEIESFVHADYDHEEMILTSEAEIEEEGHEEDVNELNQKCDAFIHRMKLTMRLEANSTLVLNSHQSMCPNPLMNIHKAKSKLLEAAKLHVHIGLNTYLEKINTRVPISRYELSTLNSASNVVLEGNWGWEFLVSSLVISGSSFKWVWRYHSHDNSLWVPIISALHGLKCHVLSAAFILRWSFPP